MGYSFAFDAVNNILRCTWEGQITDDLISQGYAAVESWHASHPPYKAIDDFSGVTTLNVSNETIRGLAASRPAHGAETMVVIVAPTDFIYGLARMFTMLGEQSRPNRHVVRTMEEAYRLLGVTSPQFSPIQGP